MSLVTNLQSLITSIGTQFKSIKTIISGSATGDVSGLATTSTNLVGAINEVRASVATATAALIDDTAPSTSKVYSSTKTDSQISAAVAALVASSPAALDTLNEFALALGNDANFAASTATAIGLKANSADVFTKTELGLDADTHNFVADFTAALA
jgi:hypothetical protein